MPPKDSAEKAVCDIRRKTRRKFSAEEKIAAGERSIRASDTEAQRALADGFHVPADDMYHGRWREILTHREKIKRLTLERRKKENLGYAA
jgi:hypothetical protein